jgi:murein L,D-transpeptidase YafK
MEMASKPIVPAARVAALVAAFLLLAAIGIAPLASARADALSGANVTKVLVKKGERRLYLLQDDAVIASYRIALGANPVGRKVFQGDGRTPEGEYFIESRNAGSNFYRALKISYPSAEDRAMARQYRIPSGGLIMIHGQPNAPRRGHNPAKDWTEGCIAVANHEMDEIWRAVDVGTPVEIQP